MAKIDPAGFLYVSRYEYDMISEQFRAFIGKSSRDAAKAILPVLFPTLTEEEINRHKICFIVKMWEGGPEAIDFVAPAVYISPTGKI